MLHNVVYIILMLVFFVFFVRCSIFVTDACLFMLCLIQFFLVLSQEIGCEERVRNDLFGVGWDVKR